MNTNSLWFAKSSCVFSPRLLKPPAHNSGARGVVQRAQQSYSAGSADELAELKRENEALRNRIRKIGVAVPITGKDRSTKNGQSGLAKAPPSNGAEMRSATAHPHLHPSLVTEEPTNPAQPASSERSRVYVNGAASNGAFSGAKPLSSSASIQTTASNTTVELPLNPAAPTMRHDERLGLPNQPSSSFPADFPNPIADALGPAPNYFTDTTGTTRRVPNTAADLVEEMQQLELKHPSDSLLALRERVKKAEAEPEPTAARPSVRSFDPARLGAALHSLVVVAAEAAPYSKTGGLGDVVGSLSPALSQRGHRVMVVVPRYQTCPRDKHLLRGLHDCQTWVRIVLGNGEHWVNFHHEARQGVDWVFVEHCSFEREGGLYGNDSGIYSDNLFRFSLLSVAACEAALQLQLPQYASVQEHLVELRERAGKSVAPGPYPDTLGADKCSVYGEDVVFIANDWHAGMLPMYLRHKYQPHDVFTNATSILAIHNLAHQGTALAPEFQVFGLPHHAYEELEWIYEEPDGRRTPVVNVMKAAILSAGSVVTVSESYAWEITRPPHGVGLHSVLRWRGGDLVGIVNGMDCAAWNPEDDPHIAAPFSADDVSGKRVCKSELRRLLGLPEPEYGVDVPLLAFIGRLDPQKGPDIVLSALSGLLALDCQVVMLGSGHPHLEDAMVQAEREHQDFFRGIVKFSEPLAHQIMAAADILLMPSRFEPCGLNQMHAMRYGTIPVAHATGGLQDTIMDVSSFMGEGGDGGGAGNGWTFMPASDIAMTAAVKGAVEVYRDQPARWRAIQRRGMTAPWGWGRAAAAYESVVRGTLAAQQCERELLAAEKQKEQVPG